MGGTARRGCDSSDKNALSRQRRAKPNTGFDNGRVLSLNYGRNNTNVAWPVANGLGYSVENTTLTVRFVSVGYSERGPTNMGCALGDQYYRRNERNGATFGRAASERAPRISLRCACQCRGPMLCNLTIRI